MNNKILVEVNIPTLNEKYDIFIPVNKKVGNVIILIVKAVNDLKLQVELKENLSLYNKYTGNTYRPDELIYNTDIRNGSKLILL